MVENASQKMVGDGTQILYSGCSFLWDVLRFLTDMTRHGSEGGGRAAGPATETNLQN
jgi:hypothetical protein